MSCDVELVDATELFCVDEVMPVVLASVLVSPDVVLVLPGVVEEIELVPGEDVDVEPETLPDAAPLTAPEALAAELPGDVVSVEPVVALEEVGDWLAVVEELAPGTVMRGDESSDWPVEGVVAELAEEMEPLVEPALELLDD